MNKDKLLTLIERYLADEATADEIQEVDAWYNQFDSLPDLDPGALKSPRTLEINRFCKIGKAE
jgi:hypothetical protein